MDKYQERMVAEKSDLDDKIKKLGEFIDGHVFSGLDAEDQTLLRMQRIAMVSYSRILTQRLRRAMPDEFGDLPDPRVEVYGDN